MRLCESCQNSSIRSYLRLPLLSSSNCWTVTVLSPPQKLCPQLCCDHKRPFSRKENCRTHVLSQTHICRSARIAQKLCIQPSASEKKKHVFYSAEIFLTYSLFLQCFHHFVTHFQIFLRYAHTNANTVTDTHPSLPV